jgi:hypothetical protein
MTRQRRLGLAIATLVATLATPPGCGGSDPKPAMPDALGTGMVVDPNRDCNPYCSCMKQACSTYAGYPFPDTAACLSACATFPEPEFKCWASFCKVPTTTMHECDHARGRFGLQECEDL